jgi:hypothetical protein
VWLCAVIALAGCTQPSNAAVVNPQQTGGAGGGLPAGGVGGASGIGGAGGVAPSGGTGGTGGAGGTGGVGGQPIAGGASGAAGTTGGSGGEVPVAGGDGGVDMGDAGEMPMPHEDLGEGDGQDVVSIGDSWMSYLLNSGGIEGALRRAGKSYRWYGIAGTTLATSIPPQYDDAIGDGPITTVIMTGGGNDIMFSGGCATKEACTMAVQEIANMLDELWTKMADDGVKDVVYIQYSQNAGSTPPENRPDMAPVPPICLSGRIRCHTVPTTDVVGPGDTVDGIHPTSAACDRIAMKVLATMVEQGIRR